AHRINLERAALELRFLPALGKVLDAALNALGIVLVVFDAKAFSGKEALLDGNPPGTVMGVAVALQTDGARHAGSLSRHEGGSVYQIDAKVRRLAAPCQAAGRSVGYGRRLTVRGAS